MRPTRTPETAPKPSAGRARSIALPCGSRMPSLGRISTRALTSLNLALTEAAPGPPDEPCEARAPRRRGEVERRPTGGLEPQDPLVPGPLELLLHLEETCGPGPTRVVLEVDACLAVDVRARPVDDCIGRPAANQLVGAAQLGPGVGAQILEAKQGV